tara:strand:- start:1041 stop:1250 length:210 start_codon:yes stop_codon:yes gene_type:complete
MKQDFEEWAHGKISLAHEGRSYANLSAQIAWSAWQRAWNIAIKKQRQKDAEEIELLNLKISVATKALQS